MRTLDFETHAIGVGKDLFPKPVGLAVRFENGLSHYYAWGHPSENNCTEDEAKRVWLDSVTNHHVCFHNAKFDLGVAARHWGMTVPHWFKIHDTMFLVYLADNLASSYGLKQSAERYLGMTPEEQDELTVLAREMGLIAWNSNKSGAVISQLPAGPVGDYAIGDVERTYKLFEHLHTEWQGEAYNRERQLMPILLKRELNGINCATTSLESDVSKYNTLREQAKERVYLKLGDNSINLNSGPELYKGLVANGLFDESKAVLTPSKKISTAKANLEVAVKDKAIITDLNLISTLDTYVDTFMTPWLLEAQANEGRVYPSFNQVRQMAEGGASKGTKTGRLSAPRFLNTPKNPEEGFPNVRSYIIPEEGHLWLKRDYSAQEYRVLGHYIGGKFAQVFIDDPLADVHQQIADWLGITRKYAKTIGFGLLYGLGMPALAEALGVNSTKAKELYAAYLGLMPELDTVKTQLKTRYKAKLPITTIGGRKIKADPPSYSTKFKRHMEYHYKLLNYLIQGGSSDVTKQAIINLDDLVMQRYSDADVLFNITVHDELNLSVAEPLVAEVMPLITEAMHAVKIDCPFSSDGSIGNSWGTMKAYV